jgi:hypothetical protein
VMVVVKEPGIDVALAQRSLNGGEIHGQTSIVNKGKEFGRIRVGELLPRPKARNGET